jgi:hypothetical protein
MCYRPCSVTKYQSIGLDNMAQLKLYVRDNSSKRTKGINDKEYTLHTFEASSEQKYS